MSVGLSKATNPSDAEVSGAAATPIDPARVNLLKSSPLFVLLAAVVAGIENYANPDLWRLILSGRQILQTGTAHIHDIYSYTVYGLPVRNHEWLAQVLMAVCYDAIAVRGLLALKFLCVGATIVFLVLALAETGASGSVQRAILILTAVAVEPNMLFRPQIFTFALLALEMALLARETFRGPARSLWLMVPAFALWANLHGGFVAGLGAMGVFAAATGVVDLLRSGSSRRAVKLGAVTAACALATLVNPLGFHAWTGVLSSTADSTWHTAMLDWQPLLKTLVNDWGAGSAGDILVDVVVPLAIFVALGAFVALACSWDDLPLLAVSAVFIVATFHTMRFASLAEIVVAVPLAYHAGLYFARRASADRTRAPDTGFNRIVAAVLIVALAWWGGLMSNSLKMKLGFRYPVGAVSFMKRSGIQGNILSAFPWASYVMWHMSPDSKIFIDQRAEIVYPDNVLKDYLDFYMDRSGAERALTGYPTEFVLVPPNARAYGVVMRNRNWKLIYRDGVAAVFARAGSSAASRFSSPVSGNSPRASFP